MVPSNNPTDAPTVNPSDGQTDVPSNRSIDPIHVPSNGTTDTN